MGPAPGTTLQKLPVEVLAAILAGCPDIKTLKSAIKTCHAFQAVFLEAQCTLSLTVLLNELDEHSRFILPDIILATKAQMRHEARGGDPRRSVSTSGISNPSAGGIPEEVQRVHELFYQDRDHSAFMWTLEAAAVASELSASVKSVAGKITFMAVGHLESQKDGRASFPSAPRLKPSRYEIARIRRAVCRLATFNILFPNQRQWHHCSPGIKLAICVFLSAQSPWENEQLACVHNLLWCLGESSIFSNSFTSAILNPALSAPTTEFDDDIIHRHLHYELNNGLSSYGLVDEQLPIQSNTWAELRNLGNLAE
ncbi:Fc.00g109240.m01.CDS01 [Cosmosporella sp. VM-42]